MKPVYKKYFTTVLLIWAAFAIVFSFLFVLVIGPQKKMKEQVLADLTSKRHSLETAKKASLPQTRAKLIDEVALLQGKLDEFVIGTDDSANLTFDIRQIADKYNIDSFSIINKPIDKASLPDCRTLTENNIEVNFRGTFVQFASFLNVLERHKPVIFVDRFSVNYSMDSDYSDKHRFNMLLSVFVAKEGK